ncbi:MAG: hypothetical protein AB197_00145 [Parcubacteria bacterium C7867-002]|nr:MAG: hypothetical protein AB197_00145 [Parcubacteria bacterium C7867-002]
MKKVLSTLILAGSQVISAHAQMSLLYPLGGENLPRNGAHTVRWTNSENVHVTLYIDWFDTNGVQFVNDHGLYESVLPAGTNRFILLPVGYPSEYQYKIRLVGTNMTVNETVSSGFVRVTGPASLEGHLNDQSPWLPGQYRTNTIIWSGFQSNDTCQVTFESPALHIGDYGFLVTNLVMTTENGTQSVVMPYPTSLPSAYPLASHNLADGPHLFFLLNERCRIINFFGEVDIVTVGLRMSLAANDAYAIARGDSAICGSVFLDTTLATNNVAVTNVAIILTSFSTNWLSLKFTLKNGSQALRTNTLSYKPSSNDQYSVKVDFPVNLTVTNGQIKELLLWCEVLTGSETGSFLWTTDEVISVAQSSVGATYVGGASIGKSVLSSTTSFIDVIQIFQPKFFLQTATNGVATFEIVCKPQVSYTLQWSTNLTTWNNDLTTNTVSDTIQFSVTVTNGNKFFRIKEN